MPDQQGPTHPKDDLLLNPGITCLRSATGRHRGKWVPGEVEELHPNVVRTNVRYLCLLCGLSMDAQVDVFLPNPGPGEAADTYQIIGVFGHVQR